MPRLKHEGAVEFMEDGQGEPGVAFLVDAQPREIDHLNFRADRVGHEIDANLSKQRVLRRAVLMGCVLSSLSVITRFFATRVTEILGKLDGSFQKTKDNRMVCGLEMRLLLTLPHDRLAEASEIILELDSHEVANVSHPGAELLPGEIAERHAIRPASRAGLGDQPGWHAGSRAATALR